MYSGTVKVEETLPGRLSGKLHKIFEDPNPCFPTCLVGNSVITHRIITQATLCLRYGFVFDQT